MTRQYDSELGYCHTLSIDEICTLYTTGYQLWIQVREPISLAIGENTFKIDETRVYEVGQEFVTWLRESCKRDDTLAVWVEGSYKNATIVIGE